MVGRKTTGFSDCLGVIGANQGLVTHDMSIVSNGVGSILCHSSPATENRQVRAAIEGIVWRSTFVVCSVDDSLTRLKRFTSLLPSSNLDHAGLPADRW